ncbi:MAG TPA: DNA primase [Syntrophaceae bacterium]|nr:DNA primase [Syntrophaceae bacterium]
MTEPTDDIGKQVKDRVAQEAAQIAAARSTGGSPGLDGRPPDAADKVTSTLINDCLFANELGDGVLYATVFRDRFVFCKNTQEWFEWSGHFWRRDIMSRSLAAVEKIVEHYLAEYRQASKELARQVAEGLDPDSPAAEKMKKHQNAFLKRASQLRADKRRTACLKFSHTIDNPIAIEGEEFDCKPMLFPCANGVIDLETGRLKPGRPGDFLSLASPIEFKGIDEPSPLWEKSLLEIFGGNADLVAYLQRLLGYAISGLVKEKVFPVLYGRTGWNGRSLIVETVSHVMGELAGSIPAEMLLSQKYSKSSSGPSPDIMSLKGIRMAFASEIDDGQRFSASKIKWLTGKDELVGRSPHDKYSTRFSPTHKLFLMTNTLPSAPANDKSFWERLHVIPFLISFVNRDPQETHERRAILDLDRQLIAEASGILAWLVRGCLLWQRDGLCPPPEVIEEGRKYQRDEDLLTDFIDECCVREPGAREKAAALYARFVEWYHLNHGKKEWTGTTFGKQLAQKFDKAKSSGCVVYRGIMLNSNQGEL